MNEEEQRDEASLSLHRLSRLVSHNVCGEMVDHAQDVADRCYPPVYIRHYQVYLPVEEVKEGATTSFQQGVLT